MSSHERTGIRSLTFSGWHRYALPENCPYVDIDCVPYCGRCSAPLAIVEVTRDTGGYKPAAVSAWLARQLGVPGLVLMYAEVNGAPAGFRLRWLNPRQGPPRWTPEEYGRWEVGLHARHDVVCPAVRRPA